MKLKLLGIVLILFTAYACSASPSQTVLLRSEDEVPRISVRDAKAALDSGAAVIVDVRSAESFAASRVAGAISIPLQNFEGSGIQNLSLEKDQWIITYCT
jgi:3-mercaptopyruvate sulfurtransferase SseA